MSKNHCVAGGATKAFAPILNFARTSCTNVFVLVVRGDATLVYETPRTIAQWTIQHIHMLAFAFMLMRETWSSRVKNNT